MEIDSEFWQMVIACAAFVASLIIPSVAWIIDKSVIKRSEYEDREKKQGAVNSSLDHRLAVIETRLSYMPSTEAMTEIHKSIAKLQTEVDGILAGIQQIDQRLYLLYPFSQVFHELRCHSQWHGIFRQE